MSEAAGAPRRPAPMAPTSGELLTGVAWACAAFLGLMLVTLFVSQAIGSAIASPDVVDPATSWTYVLIVLFYATLVGGVVTLGVAILGLPIARLLAHALRTVTSVGVHVAVYAALGAAVGTCAVAAYAALASGQERVGEYFWTPLLPITVSLTTVSVVFGWLRASRSARRALRDADPRSPIGLARAFDETTGPH